jgi:hypothetical protein
MGITLPPHIYDTKSAADRKGKIGVSENGVFQQNRPVPVARAQPIIPNARFGKGAKTDAVSVYSSQYHRACVADPSLPG